MHSPEHARVRAAKALKHTDEQWLKLPRKPRNTKEHHTTKQRHNCDSFEVKNNHVGKKGLNEKCNNTNLPGTALLPNCTPICQKLAVHQVLTRPSIVEVTLWRHRLTD